MLHLAKKIHLGIKMVNGNVSAKGNGGKRIAWPGKCMAKNSGKDHNMFDILRKFDIFFSLIGIYSRDGVGCHYRNVFLKMYTSFVAGTFILQTLISIMDAYLTFSCSAVFILHLLATLASFYCVVVYFVWLVFIQKRKDTFSTLANALEESRYTGKFHYMIIISKAFLVCYNIATIVFCVFQVYSHTVPNEIIQHSDVIMMQDPTKDNLSLLKYIFVQINMYYNFSATALLQVNLISWCYLISITFTNCTKEMMTTICRGKEFSLDTIEKIRFRFEKCLKLVIHIDKYFSLYIGFTVMYCLCIICAAVYLAASNTRELEYIYIGLINACIFLIITVVSPALLQNSVSVVTY